MEQLKSDIRDCIASNKVDKAFNLLKEYLKDHDQTTYDSVLLLENQFTAYKRKEMLGLGPDSSDRQKIIFSLLEITSNLKEGNALPDDAPQIGDAMNPTVAGPRKLIAVERKQLGDFILEHFNIIEFQSFLLERTEIDYYNYMSPLAGFNVAIPQFINTLNKNYKLFPVISALEAKFPQFPFLKQLSHGIGLNYHTYDETPANVLSKDALERKLNNEPWFDTDMFYQKLGKRKRCICRVEVTRADGKISTGTGFLISPNQVMTNFHVIESVLDNPDLLNSVKFRFDFEKGRDEGVMNSGTEININSDDPVFTYSKYCDNDKNGEADITKECTDEYLDYAILNLAEEAGNNPFGINAAAATDGNIRGWIDLKNPQENMLFEGGSLIILQHPEGDALKMALGLNKVSAVSPNKKRVRYSINTQPGSSGSPVFNTNFELVALHNMGDPRYIPKFNQGVVIERIIEDLTQNKGYNIQLCPE